MNINNKIISDRGRLTVSGAPEGFDALLLAEMARAGNCVVHIARDAGRAAAMADALAFFAPDIELVEFPAWDCLPYDRVSPNPGISSQRMSALHRLSDPGAAGGKLIVLTSVNAALQRLPARQLLEEKSFPAIIGKPVNLNALMNFLARNGYARAGTVVEPGDFALRGGLLDVFPPGAAMPRRLDFFGDVLETIREFDPETQRSIGKLKSLVLMPVSEVVLDEAGIRTFRAGYVRSFGAVTDGDPLYESISEGRKYQGMEHWLPLFHERLGTLFDYLPQGEAGPIVCLDHLADQAIASRIALIADYYDARSTAPKAQGLFASSYKALPPDALYVQPDEWEALLSQHRVRNFTPYQAPENALNLDAGGHQCHNFAPERKQENVNIYEAVRDHATAAQTAGKQILIAAYSTGSRERLGSVLADHGMKNIVYPESWEQARSVPRGACGLIVLGIENGFENGDLLLIGEQDILGDRLVRQSRRSRRAENFLTEASSLSAGDLVVHIEHGIGRYEGLQTLDINGAPHDCLLLSYHAGDKLYLPVENIELLTRYGSEDASAQLDRLGSASWQNRRARLKKRIREMAEELIKVAAARALRDVTPVYPPDGMYTEFCARFPYQETEDQMRAIEAVQDDLASGRPMDRLICGDVGFGKTEIALRSAFVAVMSGYQVAVIVPTTLLCRQHYRTFLERFEGMPVRIAQLSRMVPAKQANILKKQIAEGQVDIVIGTHALLGKAIGFKNLGLLIVDEEQHFGVGHKERLKQLRSDVHVLTMTATPIPRTLQLALSGVRELSVIATPPVDRLAVRTFVSPFDPVLLREALLREHYRGGQSFYVCPRIADLPEAEAWLKEFVPEVKYVVAHGQMPPGQLDDVMNAFYDRKYDVLLSTTIIESGLDIPTANTMLVHRADMFGLAQLYQLRGRIGRSKVRAFCYLTLPPRKVITPAAEKRLKVLQTLDTLGAGFSLASHDMDIRGAGNLLGEEQSGHIREVGFELYQEMLEEAVAALRSGGPGAEVADHWSPQISLGASVLIPESYVADLNVRLSLYRRLAQMEGRHEIDAIAAELIDRFGALPDEVNQLLKIVAIKQHCRLAGIERIDAGPKGAVISFRNAQFVNPAGLIDFLTRHSKTAKLRPDHKMIYQRNWETANERMAGVTNLTRTLSGIARAAGVAA
ncbi:MAG: transcription-repair coupling factor (superfamily II helicase) [Alphaproteobacteria bacterium]|nr:transcription-repair coupling factor (superfamily II helicase) [Alphaproteobacteria bacterium]